MFFMIKLLDKYIDNKQEIVIVKMDIYTYENLKDKNSSIKELLIEARNSDKVFNNIDELFYDLEN